MTSSPMPPTPATSRRWAAAAVCALAGGALFQWFGNANHGYIDTASLFWWWGFQWFNPGSETQHGVLILVLGAWLLGRNLRNPECRLRAADCGMEDLAAEAKVQSVAAFDRATGSSDNESLRGRTARSGPGSRSENPHSAILIPQSTAAVAAMGGALVLHAVGFAAQQARLSIVALLLFAWGVLRLGGGPRWGRAAVFPLGFLVFAIPLNALDSIGFWLRVWVIDASTAVAHALHIGVLQNGTQLVAPDGRYHYDVAAACSGIRSLMALSALSLLIGYLNFRSWWRRVALLLLCFPLVYLGNVLRILAIIVAAQLGGPRWGDAAHEVMGYGVFVIVLGGVLLSSGVLRRNERRQGAEARHFKESAVGGARERDIANQPATHDEPPTRIALGGITATIVLLVAADGVFLHHLASSPERGQVGVALTADGRNPVELPGLLGREWVGLAVPVSAVEREILPPDTGFSRMEYVSSRTRQHVLLSIVLSGRDRTSIHRPELCLIGQGWTIMGTSRHEFLDRTHPDNVVPATVLRVRREQATPHGTVLVPQLVAYWFVSGDAVVATHARRLWLDGWNRVVHARADRWAYVLMQADASDGERAALARMQQVLDGTLGVFAPSKPATGRVGERPAVGASRG